MARPIELTPEVIDRICQIIGPGVRRKDAALAAGVSESAYYKWIARGNREQARMDALALTEPDPDEAVFIQFLQRTTHAWAEAKVAALIIIRQGAGGRPASYDENGNLLTREQAPDWRAAAWWVERTYPIEYGRQRVVVEHAAALDGIEQVDQDDVAEAIASAAEAYLADQIAP